MNNVIILTALMLAGCSPTFEAGAYVPVESQYTVGNGPVIMFGVRQEITPATYCEYQHISQLKHGWPFNDDQETTFDLVGCGVSFDLWGD